MNTSQFATKFDSFDVSVFFESERKFIIFDALQGIISDWKITKNQLRSQFTVSTQPRETIIGYDEVRKRVSLDARIIRSAIGIKGKLLVLSGSRGVIFWDIENYKEFDFIPFPIEPRSIFIQKHKAKYELMIVSSDGVKFTIDITPLADRLNT